MFEYYKFIGSSRPKTLWGLSWELHFLDTEQSAVLVKGIVNVRQVQQGRSLPYSTELVVDWAVADADPAIVCS